jgi:hypothetical protein
VDAANRATKTVTDPTGSNLTVSRTFDANDNVLSQILSNGTETRSATYTYDAGGNEVSTSVVNGSTTLKTTQAYNQLREFTAQTDPRGYLPGAETGGLHDDLRIRRGRPGGPGHQARALINCAPPGTRTPNPRSRRATIHIGRC